MGGGRAVTLSGVELREYHKATRCEFRGRLRRCRGELLGQCVYCARGFCERHGRIWADGQEICRAERCEALRQDVAAHLLFKEQGRERNADGQCGEPACALPATLNCDRCRCRYCEDHIQQVIMTVPRGGELQTEAVAICDHCRARLPLWAEQ